MQALKSASLGISAFAAAMLFAAGLTPASAQNYPNKPIRMVTTDAGGSADFFARGLVQALASSLGQPVVVENHAGSGVIPGEVTSRATPDGYTILFFTMNVWVSPLLQKANYDPIKDLAPITLASRASSVLVVNNNLPASSVKELVALAKSKPGDLVYAHGSSGSASHLTGAMFRSFAGVQMLNVAYKGSAQALTDVMAGRAQLMFPNSAVVPPLLKSGKLRALAVTTAERSPFFPDLPTVAETIPGFVSTTTNGLWAPAKTPDAIVRRLNQAAVSYIQAPDTRTRLANTGVEAVGSTPQEFSTFIAADMARWAKVIKDTGIKAEDGE